MAMEGPDLHADDVYGQERIMRKDSRGFTLVELMVVMLITMFVLYAATQTLGALVIQFKQQAKITDTNISSILGLGILRRDVHSAGYGLPYSDRSDYDSANNNDGRAGGSPIPYTFQTASYLEVPAGGGVQNYPGIAADNYNDAATSPPRAVVSGVGVGPNGSDYLVIKSMSVAANPAAGKFHILRTDGTVSTNSPTSLNLRPTDRVIVLSPDLNSYTLILSAGTYFSPFDNDAATANVNNNLSPFSTANLARIIYGVDGNSGDNGTETLRAPFNRADYYISYRNVPERCAHQDMLNPGPGMPGFDPALPPSDRTNLANPGTGVLVKTIMDHKEGDFNSEVDNAFTIPLEIPLLDCVADFKVIYGLDTDNIESIDTRTDGVTAIPGFPVGWTGSAFDMRQVREVSIFILAHEGAFSPDFQYTADPDGDGNPNTVDVGENGLGDVGINIFDVSNMDQRWQNFRWKVYKLVDKPAALR